MAEVDWTVSLTCRFECVSGLSWERCFQAAGVVLSRSRGARAVRRRKRRLSMVVNDLTAEQWDALQAAWVGCACCGVGVVQRQQVELRTHELDAPQALR